ncbi:MAG: Fic family protein [Clostridiales bacterium]|nr:Fic family protein [Clostridiales bacterium]
MFDDVDVMRNLLGIRDAEELERAEADITYSALADVDGSVAALPFDLTRLLAIHKHIFGDLFDWAGTPRSVQIAKGERVLGNDTVRYSYPDNIERDAKTVLKRLETTDWYSLDVHATATAFAKHIAALWQVHPFREGNTRTTITFAAQFAEAHGFRMDKTLLKDSAAYVRDALVKASDGQYSEYGYLVKIFEDAILRG